MKKVLFLLAALLPGLAAAATDFPVVYTYDTSKPQQAFELRASSRPSGSW